MCGICGSSLEYREHENQLREVACEKVKKTNVIPKDISSVAFPKGSEIPSLPRHLKKIWVYESQMEDLPDLSELVNLVELHLYRCNNITKIGTLPPNLNLLYLQECSKIREISAFPDRMSSIVCHDCIGISFIPPLPSLLRFTIRGSPALTELPDLPDCLREFDCGKNINLLEIPRPLPTKLLEFNCEKCPKIERIPKIPQNLMKLICNDCPLIVYIPRLPPSIIEVGCRHCKSLKKRPQMPITIQGYDFTDCPCQDDEYFHFCRGSVYYREGFKYPDESEPLE